METLNCSNCGNALVQDELDERLLLIACSHCGTMHDVYKARHGRTMPADKEMVPIPEKFKVTENGDELLIRFKHQNWIMAFFAFVGFLFIGGIVSTVLGRAPVLGDSVFGNAWLLGPVAAGYYILRKARIVVRKRIIKLRMSKYLLLKSNIIVIKSVDQLFVRRHVYQTDKGTIFSYSLNVIYQQEKTHVLLNGFAKAQDAQALEHLIERWSGIADVGVFGEYRD